MYLQGVPRIIRLQMVFVTTDQDIHNKKMAKKRVFTVCCCTFDVGVIVELVSRRMEVTFCGDGHQWEAHLRRKPAR